MKLSNVVILICGLVLWFSMPFYEFFMLILCWTLGFGAFSVLRALLFSVAQKTASSNGSITKLQKEDERRYMPKELLEATKN